MMVWKNGEIISGNNAVDASDRGVTLGDGLFETIAVVDGAPMRLNRHIDRLERGLDTLGISAEIESATIGEALKSLGQKTDTSEGALRVTVLRGSGARGVMPAEMSAPTILISFAAMKVGDVTPLEVVIARGTRRNDLSPMSRIKSTNYGDAILARMEAGRVGADDALMLNTRDTIAEATAANIFCVIDGAVVTPPVSDGALPGVMRDLVMTYLDVTEASITEADLSQADEVFLTSSISIRPVISINSIRVGTGQPGPVWAGVSKLPGTAA